MRDPACSGMGPVVNFPSKTPSCLQQACASPLPSPYKPCERSSTPGFRDRPSRAAINKTDKSHHPQLRTLPLWISKRLLEFISKLDSRYVLTLQSSKTNRHIFPNNNAWGIWTAWRATLHYNSKLVVFVLNRKYVPVTLNTVMLDMYKCYLRDLLNHPWDWKVHPELFYRKVNHPEICLGPFMECIHFPWYD